MSSGRKRKSAASSNTRLHSTRASTNRLNIHVALRTPTLPQELVNSIIDNLSDDKTSLGHCSLVCRAWAQPTATHLFHHRRWPKCQHYWTKTRKVANCSCEGEKPITLPALRDFLHASNRISCALRELEFNFERVAGGARPDAPGFMPMGCVNIEELMDVFDATPNLRSVKIKGVIGSSWAVKDRSAGQENRSLDTFQFSDTLNLDPHDLAAIVSNFGRISTMTIGPNARALVLPGQSPHPLPSVSAARTRIGALDFHSTCHAQSVLKCIAAVGPVIDASHLTEVSFNLPLSADDVDGFIPFFDSATELDRFTFGIGEVKVRGSGPGHSAPEYWTSLKRLLPRCSARRISLHGESKSMTPADFREYVLGLAWREVDEAVASNNRLELLQFCICSGLDMGGFDLDGIRDVIRRSLSGRLSNILSFAVARSLK